MTQFQSDSPVFSDEQIKVGFGSTEGKSSSYKKGFTWDPKTTSLSKANAHFSATQTYLSGASIDLFVNGALAKTLHWGAGETATLEQDVDITSLMVNGDNEFILDYKTAYGVLTDQLATVTMDVLVQLDTTETGNPLTTSNTSSSSFWSKLASYATTIIAIVIILGIVTILVRVIMRRNLLAEAYSKIRSVIR